MKLFLIFNMAGKGKLVEALLPSKNRFKASAGFSLIELLVSMALFIVVLTIGIGALLVLISTNLKAQNIQDAVGNVQFALDSMAREIRTGYSYYCASNANVSPGGYSSVSSCNQGTYLSFIEGGESLTGGVNNNRLAYCYASSAIWRKIGSNVSSCGGSGWVRLTSPSVSITDMHFNVGGTDQKLATNDTVQPNVTIYITGTVTGVSNTSSTFNIQTTVTQRLLDL